MISSVVTAWKTDELDVARGSTSATGELAVAARMPCIHLGCEVVGEFIRRRRLGDDGWWRLVVASTMASTLATTTLEYRVCSL